MSAASLVALDVVLALQKPVAKLGMAEFLPCKRRDSRGVRVLISRLEPYERFRPS
jgi:hypothetical protein